MFKMFLDDDALTPGMDSFRYPPDNSFTIATSLNDAIELTQKNGCPNFIDFDHDLGVDASGIPHTAMEYLYWLVYDFLPKDNVFIPEYRVHSKNPNGAANIHSFMKSWSDSLKR